MTEVLGRSARKRQTILSAGRDAVPEQRLPGHQRRPDRRIGRGVQTDRLQAFRRQAGTAARDREPRAGQHGRRRSSDRIAALADTADLEADLIALAGDYLRAVLAGAGRAIAAAGGRRGQPGARVGAALLRAGTRPHARGVRRMLRPCCTTAACFTSPNPPHAAEHFAFLIVGQVHRPGACSAAGRRCWQPSTSTTTSGQASGFFSPPIRHARR